MKKILHKITAKGMRLAAVAALVTTLHADPQKTSEKPSEKPGEELTVRVMTYNVCRGGTYWGQPLSQSAKMIELAKPGFTWNARVKPDDTSNHRDRIDYVYFRGKGLKVTDVKVIGANKENGDIVVAPYPSDHCAVVATFTLAKQTKSEKPEKPDPNKPDAGNGK